MSEAILNPDQIAALVEAAKQGQMPEHSSGGPRRGPRLRTVDFSRPTKFTSDHQRRVSRAIDTFCQTAATRLSAELRCPIELEAINTTQLTWNAAQAKLPAGSIAVTLDVHPIGTRMLLTAEQAFVLTGLECLLGGSADRPPRERRLSEIDWSLARRLLESIVHQLSVVWQDLAGVSLSAGGTWPTGLDGQATRGHRVGEEAGTRDQRGGRSAAGSHQVHLKGADRIQRPDRIGA